MSTTVTADERDRLYAMAREAQLRDIKPLAVKPEKGVKTKRAPAGPKCKRMGCEKSIVVQV